MPIDFFEKKKLNVGNIICIYGTYYPISNWYVHNIDENLLTLIKLDNNYIPLLIEPELIQIEKNLIKYYKISNASSIKITQNYFQSYYKNRVLKKKPRYGDILHIKNNLEQYEIFRVLNFDPVSGSYLCIEGDYSYKKNYCSRNHNIILNLSDYVVVSTKELRRDIIEKSKQMKLTLSMCNYERLYRLDDIIEFKYSMNYLVEQSDLNHVKLNELMFLYSENNEVDPLQDLIKFDSLELEDKYSPEYNDNYKWINNVVDTTEYDNNINIEEYIKSYTPIMNITNNLDQPNVVNDNNIDQTNDNPIIKYFDDNINIDKKNIYDVWNTNTICDNYNCDEVISFYDYRNTIVSNTYYEHNSIDNLDNYIYNEDLIQLYDSDSEADLKNMETFSFHYDLNNTYKKHEDSLSEILEGKSYTTSCYSDNEPTNEKVEEILPIMELFEQMNKPTNEKVEEILPIMELFEQMNKPTNEKVEEILPIIQIVENIDEYITLEKEDFEPFEPERSCSIM